MTTDDYLKIRKLLNSSNEINYQLGLEILQSLNIISSSVREFILKPRNKFYSYLKNDDNKDLSINLKNGKVAIELNLSGKNLTEFPKGLELIEGLISLKFSHNEIKGIPKKIKYLKNLERLDFSYNKNIGSVDLYHLTQLRHLRVLNIENCNLKDFPMCFKKSESLSVLYIGRNKISRIPPSISSLKNLTYIDLSNNRIGSIPKSLFELEYLNFLNLASNQLPISEKQKMEKYLNQINIQF